MESAPCAPAIEEGPEDRGVDTRGSLFSNEKQAPVDTIHVLPRLACEPERDAPPAFQFSANASPGGWSKQLFDSGHSSLLKLAPDLGHIFNIPGPSSVSQDLSNDVMCMNVVLCKPSRIAYQVLA